MGCRGIRTAPVSADGLGVKEPHAEGEGLLLIDNSERSLAEVLEAGNSARRLQITEFVDMVLAGRLLWGVDDLDSAPETGYGVLRTCFMTRP